MKAAITHSSVVLPSVRVASDRSELTGISQLRYALKNEKSSHLAIEAIRSMQTTPAKALIVATTSPDVPSPATAHKVLSALQWPSSTLGFDVTSSCTSFLSAVFAGSGFLSADSQQRVCVVASEVKHNQINENDTRLKSLFGDGACGIMLEPSQNSELELAYSKVRHDLTNHIGVDYELAGKPQLHIFEPKRMYREILREMHEAILELWDKRTFQLKSRGIDSKKARGLVYVHQANAKLLEDLRDRLPYEIGSRLPILISDIGNTVSASLPVLRTRSAFLLARESGQAIQTSIEGHDICYVTLYSGERMSVRDCGAVPLNHCWMDELSPFEIGFFKEIAPGQRLTGLSYTCDVWVSAGGGFQTLGCLHQYPNKT